jgi:hypothetical protein
MSVKRASGAAPAGTTGGSHHANSTPMTMAATISGSRIGSNGDTQRPPGANAELPGVAEPVKVLNSGA